jgi:hypothetical protein
MPLVKNLQPWKAANHSAGSYFFTRELAGFSFCFVVLVVVQKALNQTRAKGI